MDNRLYLAASGAKPIPAGKAGKRLQSTGLWLFSRFCRGSGPGAFERLFTGICGFLVDFERDRAFRDSRGLAESQVSNGESLVRPPSHRRGR